ncbi:MAG: CoB--CoM heterodisulfide reductase iron-sulfur subunit A family protein, partial [Defluviitaleaceae bacterium]|nr:CoB--CoM heterodisulfide reductase iron-sulfur subunit A family protein [Defluviitaleaceae bacterium]
MKKPVMVIGGGIAGIQAAHDLAEMGVPVFLVEASPTIGGRMAQLDKTFPTNDCSTCILAPKMTACYNHPLVKTLTFSEVTDITGDAPNLVATVKLKPRYVNEHLCTGCNACFDVCPIKVKSEFDMGVGMRKAIYKPFAQAIPNKAIIDMDACVKCRRCVKACNPGAIDFEQQVVYEDIPVSAIIMAAGFETTDSIPKEFGYERYADVVTSLEYERIMCAGGPFEGHIKRPSDDREPKRIAFIQCVGSRDHQCDSDYCSSICCMQAVKGAIITKEHMPDLEGIDIFYMDMRAFGKGFDNYVDSAKDRYNIGFVRSRISEIEEQDGQLLLKYTNEKGNGISLPYDLVVLSVGLKPVASSVELLKKAGVKTDRYGFVWSHEFDPAITTRKGLFACGAGASPKDIPETVIEASGTAAAAAKIAGSQDIDLYNDPNYSSHFKQTALPPMRDISKEPIRIGVFVCNCGVNIGGYADVKDITAYAKSLPFVVHAEQSMYACAIDAQQVIADKIAEHGLNRIVIAACTPRTHETLFQDVMAKAGLNPYLLAMANIRDQCTWVHMDDKPAATFKAKELVRMAVGKVTFAKQLTRKQIDVNKSALVIGSGTSGMTAALELADTGYPVHLVEASEKLGGNALGLAHSNLGRPVAHYLNQMTQKIENHRNIDVYLNTTIETIDGYVGNFNTTVKYGDFKKVLGHGVVIIAVGAYEHKPAEYLYGKVNNVITQMDLEGYSANRFSVLEDAKHLVMIQCVGSREKGREYCSRVCCNQAIKNALLIKEQHPDMDITILYRDIRAYGMGELQYRDARKAGIIFIRYDVDNKPVVEKHEENNDNALQIKVWDAVLQSDVVISADYLVLSSAMEPNVTNNTAIAQMLKVPLNQNGFFLEAHVKLRPVDFATEGIYVCGLAHAPKNIKESIIQGKAAAGRAATVIAKDHLESEGAIATVRQDYCASCGDCERICPYKAIELSDKHAVINEVLCKGCGTCSAACRCGAIDINGFSDKQVLT